MKREKEGGAGRRMFAALALAAAPLVAASAWAMDPAPGWREQCPWNPMLCRLQTALMQPPAHTLLMILFVAAGALYAFGGNYPVGVRRLAAVVLGGAAARGRRRDSEQRRKS